MKSQKSQSKQSLNSSNKISNNDVKKQLKEFYETAKTNLQKLKEELVKAESDYNSQKEDVDKKDLEYKELLAERNEWDVKLKGINERIIIAKRVCTDLEKENKILNEAIDNETRDIDWRKGEAAKKVEIYNTDVAHVENLKIEQLKRFDERIEKEKNKNDELRLQISEVEDKIKEIKNEMEQENVNEGKEIEELAKVNKILAEL